ncbi:hypothetical protein ACFLRM_03120 [Acidobacteriota bacterium]
MNMVKKTSFRATRAALGCGVLLIFLTGIFGMVVSFFAKDPVLATEIRKRCLIGIGIGIVMIFAWKVYKNNLE